MKLVFVEWVDCSGSIDTAWRNDTYMDTFVEKDERIYDVGFVYHEDKESLVLVGGYSIPQDTYETVYHREVKIPKAVIKRRLDLSRHIKKKKKNG